ncbi:hypothetical protein DVH24_009920 [Malus domestica]|uniref:Uncharacterized protein n=1 Tax=Malus domestica TaxID=3750 RepID=A0A498JR17_MALDO|nr:hypothetical protein DVH24_009920 [Malus domestica]
MFSRTVVHDLILEQVHASDLVDKGALINPHGPSLALFIPPKVVTVGGQFFTTKPTSGSKMFPINAVSLYNTRYAQALVYLNISSADFSEIATDVDHLAEKYYHIVDTWKMLGLRPFFKVK